MRQDTTITIYTYIPYTMHNCTCNMQQHQRAGIMHLLYICIDGIIHLW